MWNSAFLEIEMILVKCTNKSRNLVKCVNKRLCTPLYYKYIYFSIVFTLMSLDENFTFQSSVVVALMEQKMYVTPFKTAEEVTSKSSKLFRLSKKKSLH